MALDRWFPLLYRPRSVPKGNMFTFELEDAPNYHALSYTWGDPNDTEAIEIDGRPFQVTKNLLAALRRLRRIRDWEYIWIDAICINQADIDEKNHQLPLMADIYKNAKEVIIWLGESPAFPLPALRLINQTYDHCQDELGGYPDDLNISNMIAALEPCIERLRLALDRERNVKAFQKLFDLPYWTRVWVLQEFANAQHGIILWRQYSTDLKKLLGAAMMWRLTDIHSVATRGKSLLGESSDEFVSFLMVVMASTRHTAVPNFRQIFLEDSSTVHSIFFKDEVLDLFFKTISFKASDPRDKFFAILNLLPPELVLIQPRYQLTEVQLYREIVISEISRLNNLTSISSGGVGLGRGGQISVEHGLPSWVADFRVFWHDDCYNLPVYVREGTLPRFSADNGEVARYTFSSDHSLLTTSGFVCDKIKTAIHKIKEWDSFGLILEAALEVQSTLKESNPFYETLFYSLMIMEQYSDITTTTSLVINTISDGHMADLRSGYMYYIGARACSVLYDKMHKGADQISSDAVLINQAAQHALASGDSALSYFLIGSARFQSIISSDLRDKLYQEALRGFTASKQSGEVLLRSPFADTTSSDPLTWMKNWLQVVFNMAYSRSFIVTNRGCMGYARQETQTGDLVCIVYGCDVPLIIRPSGDGKYVIVGDSYLYGMMSGQMVKLQKEENFTTEYFTFQ